jgi:hypothetical protein
VKVGKKSVGEKNPYLMLLIFISTPIADQTAIIRKLPYWVIIASEVHPALKLF